MDGDLDVVGHYGACTNCAILAPQRFRAFHNDDRAFKRRLHEVRAAEIRSAKVCLIQLRQAEVRPAEM